MMTDKTEFINLKLKDAFEENGIMGVDFKQSLDLDLDLDSMQLISLLVTLESIFDIEIDESILYEKFPNTPNDFVELVSLSMEND